MTLSEQVPFGAGIWMIGDWLAQIPAFGGYAAFTIYLPARKLAIAVAVTVNEAAFDDKGNFLLPNPSVPVGAAIASLRRRNSRSPAAILHHRGEAASRRRLLRHSFYEPGAIESIAGEDSHIRLTRIRSQTGKAVRFVP